MKNPWHTYVAAPFRQALAEIPWFGPVISAVLVALLVNLLTEALTTLGGLWLGAGVVAVLALVAIVYVNIHAKREIVRRGRGLGLPVDLPNPEKRRGLIFLYSREETLREAIRHHRPALAHCWLLATPEMQEAAAEAIGHFSDLAFTLHPLADRYNSQACYRAVRAIYRREAPRLGLDPHDVIADITGGTKPLTMGMIVACLEGGYPIEHVPTAFDATGKPTGPLPPIQIAARQGAEGG